MSLAVALQQLANEVRPKTIYLLEQAGEQELRWAPAGTSNHILWHAGHALWLGDVLCLEPITAKSSLPPTWAEIFGANCKPVAQTKAWPAKAQVLSLLRAQLRRINEELARITDEQLDRVISPTSGATLGKWILHGLHDEANHQGEMHLLLKIQRGLRRGAAHP
jgi:hypothetical protein